MMKRSGLLFLWLVLALGIAGQTTVRVTGSVEDAETAESLPFVSITALPSGSGTMTDGDGSFAFDIPARTRTLQFSFLGYQPVEIEVSARGDTSVQVRMEPTEVELQEAVVTAERRTVKDEKAIALQNLVIENKDRNRPKGMDSYTYREYVQTEFSLYNIGPDFTERKILRPFRVAFDNIDTTAEGTPYMPFLLYETLTDVHFQRSPRKEQRVLVASDFTGIDNESVAGLVDDLAQEIDAYADVIELGGKPFPSPFSTTGLSSYRYYLTDSVITDSTQRYRLDFSPRNKNMVGMRGTAWIDGRTYAIRSFEVTIPKEANINFVSDFRVRQDFEEVRPGRYVVTGDRLQAAFSILKRRNNWKIMVDKTTVRDDLRIDVALPDSVFSGEVDKEMPQAFDRDSSWWARKRPVPLEWPQNNIAPVIDSIERTRAYRRYRWLGHLGTTAFLRAGPIEFGRFYKFVSWNDIEGVRLRFGARTNLDFSEKMRFWAYGAYGLGDRRWKYYASAKFILPEVRTHWQALEFVAQEDFTFLGQDIEHQLVTHDNIVNSLLRGGELTKIMKIRNVGVTYERDWTNRLSSFARIHHKTYFEVDGVFDFERPAPWGGVQELEAFSTFELGASLRFAFNQSMFNNGYYRTFLNVSKPVLSIDYTWGVPGVIGSDYGFHKLLFEYYHRWANRAGITRYGLQAGAVFGDIPYPLMFLHVGNETFLFNRFAFNMMNEFEYANDQFVHGWVEHHFDGKIMDRIPGINKLRLRTLVSANAMIGNVRESNEDLIAFPEYMDELDNWYVQAGFGVENIFSMIRTDFLWRITQRDKPGVQTFAVKVSLRPSL